VLGSVEANLTSFRNDLAAVSADIESLQSRSTNLNIRLGNRKAVEKALGPLVEELSVSPVVVSKISEGQIDESWAKMLVEVDKRAASYRSNTTGSRQSKAWADMGPLLEKLVAKVRLACARTYPAMLTETTGHREDTGLPCRANQGAEIPEY
jgi:vacuolar protein sorting-associated protein 52